MFNVTQCEIKKALLAKEAQKIDSHGFKFREQLMSSASEHWTRYDVDTCPRLDTCPYPNGSSDH